ncbi:PorP/SprF family type IX secretion system membrane protein [Chondrinema litorale]|uniref:PorP/SprF family type IX secretion system membrane protein n=1 Tax=Chondrinema litorale TaxID=2994555 RepID=UPI00254370A2|nr:PorP/SprF family type IX secretion system membrane protein [Chondrinema litorale]UZR98487.1 PorP/SprF family type IX secretion system membrane protein [Chondrinema litorale]
MKNLKNTFLITTLLTLLNGLTWAQTNFQYNFYNQNQFVYNPSLVGQQENTNVFVNYRQQWAGFDGAPRTAIIGGQTGYASTGGIGLVIMNNRWGVIDDNLIQLSNSYGFKLSRKDQFNLGISIGLTDRQINYNRLTVEDYAEDDFLNSRLTALSEDWSFNTGFGFSYSRANLTLAFSSPELYNTRDDVFLQSKITYVSYSFLTTQEKIKFTPSVLIKALQNNPTQYDLSVKTEWNNTLWIQPTYRSSKNVIISTGINYESISIGYSFELASSTQNINNNSHEIVVAVNFNKKKKDKYKSGTELTINSDSLQIANLKQENTLTKEQVSTLQKEIEALKAQMGGLSEIVSLNNVDTVSLKSSDAYKIKYDKDANRVNQAMESGYYVVINTCTSLEFSKHLAKIYNGKGIEATIAHNEKKGYYYIFTQMLDNRDEGLKAMEKKREEGFKNAWLLVFNK